MGVDAEVLILGPFREVVERGREAVSNAEDVEDEDLELSNSMLKASQSVLKEGERALKRLQPLWDGQVEKYGDAFRNALSQNGTLDISYILSSSNSNLMDEKTLANFMTEDIEEKRRKLEDLLYDFEDYTEADTFEAERFTELQAATRALALHAIDLVKKIKLDPPNKLPAYSAPASSKFPPLPPLPPMPATRSASVSSSVSGTPVGRTSRPRRAPTPAGCRGGERSRSPPPALPQRSPDGPPASSRQDPSLSLTSLETSDAVSPPPRVLPGRRNNYDRLNMNSTRSQRSVASNRTSRSRNSQMSAGSAESMPPPAYTAAGEAIAPVPPLPQDELPHALSSRASTPELLPEPAMPHALTTNQQHHQHASPTDAAESEAPTASYSVFPSVRRSSGGPGTRTTAWVSDQVDSSSRIQPNRPGSRYEPHSLQTLQSLQSLTIPEDKAVGIVRPKHASVIDFSPLTPMLSQLSQFSVESPAASSPSGSVGTSSPQTARMSPLSQGTSVSSFQTKFDHPHPLHTPDESIETRMDPLRADPTLMPLSLPAAAFEHPPNPQSPPAPALPSPTQIPPAIPEEWKHGPPTVISDRGSVAGLSSHSLSSSLPGCPQPREPDVGIGPRSSLYALNGFCAGAQDFKSTAHQDGVRRLAGHVAGVSTATARCANCSYGHAFSELDLDVNDKSPRATFPRPGGVLFRIRLLYKSHLAAQRPSEAFYGCLFCAQTGTVVREGDATVFRSSDDLFRHLARHPQPLPEVPGVTVLYGKEILTTDPRVNDFDLWLTEEPAPPPHSVHMPPLALSELLACLPVATAARSHVQRYAEKKLPRPDGQPAEALLQFFVGARIIGVEFPRAFAGKWCTGWHDGEWGYFPSKVVELEKPQPGRLDAPPLQFQAASAVSISVVARWKWDPAATIKDAVERGWVAFDKGEKITNVGWPVLVEGVAGGGREAWCWSGTNAKGRFGVFPRSHVDEATLRDDMRPITPGGGGGGGRRKKEGGGKGGAKSLFGVRRRASTSSTFSGGGITEII